MPVLGARVYLCSAGLYAVGVGCWNTTTAVVGRVQILLQLLLGSVFLPRTPVDFRYGFMLRMGFIM